MDLLTREFRELLGEGLISRRERGQKSIGLANDNRPEKRGDETFGTRQEIKEPAQT